MAPGQSRKETTVSSIVVPFSLWLNEPLEVFRVLLLTSLWISRTVSLSARLPFFFIVHFCVGDHSRKEGTTCEAVTTPSSTLYPVFRQGPGKDRRR